MPKISSKPSRPGTFDLARSPLEGFNLIDASAGTGKTYTICGLVLRLLLEKNLAIEQILVVTFTEAATEDLRNRIRQTLRRALLAVGNGASDDSFLQEYLKIAKPVEAAQRLSDALRSFDEAAIYTIHGFCHRMLLENSFESNTLFDTELIADDSELIKEIIEDYWRRALSESSNLFCTYATDKLTPDSLQSFLKPLIPHFFLQFIPDMEFAVGCRHLTLPEKEYTGVYRSVCREWTANRREIVSDLLNSQALKRNIYTKAGLADLITAMDEMASTCRPSPCLFKKFALLTSGRIKAGTKAKHPPNILAFHTLCEQLLEAANNLCASYDRCLIAHHKRFLDSFRDEFNLRKKRDNVYTFDDLLCRLHGTLTGPAGSFLAETIARKYPAALIDEFQDTDPLQYEIFKAIYDKRFLLFLIGDPKQAIYSFRGADIFTYMDAASSPNLAHHTLGINHRSTPTLVKAVNTFFSRAPNPFVFDAISFHSVSPALKEKPKYLTVDGRSEEPFIIWYLGGASVSGGNKPVSSSDRTRISKSAARRFIISRVGAEICRLLNHASENRIRINGRQLLAGDIAILVRKNDEARKMQQALAALQIPSVLHSGDDLFASEDAKEMLLLLEAVAFPNSLDRVKTGLITRFIGVDPKALQTHDSNSFENEEIIEHWLVKFKAYHELWSHHGFIKMFWTVLRENRVRQRLLADENGERRLTNILHLAEILHQEALQRGLNITALLAYLHERLAGGGSKKTEHQLRLESDEDRVKIVTIHKAKGLEYPVVFCPFTWDGSRLRPGEGCLFHRPGNGQRTELVFDAGSDAMKSHLQLARQEEMAENLRLFYVAITRAVHRCYFIWGPISGAETSAPAYLLHQDPDLSCGHQIHNPADCSFMDKTANRFLGLSEEEILTDLRALAADSEGTIRISKVEDLQVSNVSSHLGRAGPFNYKQFTGTLDLNWKISSFSSIIQDPAASRDDRPPTQDRTPDHDTVPAPQSLTPGWTGPGEDTLDIYSFPHGAKPGILLHELLEQADFRKAPPVAEHRINEKLLNFGYETTWCPVISEMLTNVCNVRLHNKKPDLKLAGIPPTDCLHEMEFYFPLTRLNPADLKRIFTNNKAVSGEKIQVKGMDRQLDNLTFAPSRGFMRGFIDLIFEFKGKFYLVDWKSNYLGPHSENYRQDKLRESMLSGFYFLQYHLYCLALHLYLKNRWPDYLYESHFGGVFYVFLRGVDRNLGPDYGIFHDLPSFSRIEQLETNLIAGKADETDNMEARRS